MKQTHTLKSDHTLTFNAGQSGKYLILRDTTHSLLLQGDTMRPVEIFGGDTVDVGKEAWKAGRSEVVGFHHHRCGAAL